MKRLLEPLKDKRHDTCNDQYQCKVFNECGEFCHRISFLSVLSLLFSIFSIASIISILLYSLYSLYFLYLFRIS